MESLRTKWERWLFNLFPCYRGTGARITYVASDYTELRVKLPLNWRTRNVVGTIFGGSLYASVDPPYMILFMKLLGPDYIVWDKSASIQFKKPGRSTLYANFFIDKEEVENIKNLAEEAHSVERNYTIDLVDSAGVVHARVDKLLYFKKKEKEKS